MKESDKAKAKELLQTLNKVTKKHNSIYLREIKKLKNHFKKGYRVEAFLGLTHVLEYQLHNFWIMYLVNSNKNSRPFVEFLGLKTYAEILWQVGYLTQSQKSDLTAFQKGRNTVAHYTSKHFQIKDHPSDEVLEDQFKKGVKIAIELANYLKFPEFKFDSKIFEHKIK